MSVWWKATIAFGISLVSCARPSASSFADGSDGLWTQQHRRALRRSRLLHRFRHRHHEPGDVREPEADPDGRAEAMRAACQKTQHDEIQLKDIRRCVEELQSYAQATREGYISSISAEKVFVREYKNAAKKLALLGDTELFWNDIQKEHKNALVFLKDLASKVGEDARDLKVYSKLKKKHDAKTNKGSGEDEDDEEEENDKDEDDEGDDADSSKGEEKDENEEKEEKDENEEKDEKQEKEEAKEEKEEKEEKDEKTEKQEKEEEEKGEGDKKETEEKEEKEKDEKET